MFISTHKLKAVTTTSSNLLYQSQLCLYFFDFLTSGVVVELTLTLLPIHTTEKRMQSNSRTKPEAARRSRSSLPTQNNHRLCFHFFQKETFCCAAAPSTTGLSRRDLDEDNIISILQNEYVLLSKMS